MKQSAMTLPAPTADEYRACKQAVKEARKHLHDIIKHAERLMEFSLKASQPTGTMMMQTPFPAYALQTVRKTQLGSKQMLRELQTSFEKRFADFIANDAQALKWP